MKKNLFFLFLLFILFNSTFQEAQAHSVSSSYTTMNIEKNQIDMVFELDEISLIELTGGDLNNNGKIDAPEFKALEQNIEDLVKKNLTLKVDGRPMVWSKLTKLELVDGETGTKLHLEAIFPAVSNAESISFTDTFYKNNISYYVDLLKIKNGDKISTTALSNNNQTWVVQQGSGKEQVGWLTFVKLGIMHILTGYDHMLFLLSLLIAGQKLKQVATFITAFTIAHSITLSLTVLGIIDVPSKIVEPCIALSICYVALENIFRKKISKRWILTFLFGLIHGMGFADLLAQMHIPKSSIAIDLASFNIGIEIIQLVIILAVFPLITLLYRWKHVKYVRISTSVFAFVLGGIWLIQRIILYYA